MEGKKSFGFGFSKTKPKVNLVKTDAVKAFDLGGKKDDTVELITGLEGKKVKSVNKPEEVKGPLTIPCPKNKLSFEVNRTPVSSADQEVINALIADAEERKSAKKEDSTLEIPADKIADKPEEKVEDPDYEEVGIESFGNFDKIFNSALEKLYLKFLFLLGLAALRGMGWNEKSGMGLNKRAAAPIEVEVRPRGLGLGAGASKKKKVGDESDQRRREDESGLRYAVGAYIQITDGKHEKEYGKIVSFGDGLSRIVVQLDSTDEKFSVLQACTRLLSKSEYKRETERSSERSSEKSSDRSSDRHRHHHHHRR